MLGPFAVLLVLLSGARGASSSARNASAGEHGGCDSVSEACVRKCCEDGFVLGGDTCVRGEAAASFRIPVYSSRGSAVLRNLSELQVLHGMVDCGDGGGHNLSFGEALLANEPPILLRDNRLWVVPVNVFISSNKYCIEYSEELGFHMIFCDIPYVEDFNFGDRLSFIGVMISLPFLLVTFIVYALLPNRSLHGTSLMCYVLALFAACLLLTFSYFYTGTVTITTCQTIGMTTLFCFMASIFWMNVMSFDICSTFSGWRGVRGMRNEGKKRRFLIYSAYAWGVPLLMIALIVTVSKLAKPNAWYDPGVRGVECFLRDGIPELLYFYGPLAVLVSANIVMFGITAYKIKTIQNDTATAMTKRGSKRHSDNQQTFSLYIKLLFAMGVNWAMELINWLVSWQISNVPPAVWYVTDFCNAAHGVFIFFVFVFKKSIWKQLKNRCCNTQEVETSSGNLT